MTRNRQTRIEEALGTLSGLVSEWIAASDRNALPFRDDCIADFAEEVLFHHARTPVDRETLRAVVEQLVQTLELSAEEEEERKHPNAFCWRSDTQTLFGWEDGFELDSHYTGWVRLYYGTPATPPSQWAHRGRARQRNEQRLPNSRNKAQDYWTWIAEDGTRKFSSRPPGSPKW